jgi:hypothetical protein
MRPLPDDVIARETSEPGKIGPRHLGQRCLVVEGLSFGSGGWKWYISNLVGHRFDLTRNLRGLQPVECSGGVIVNFLEKRWHLSHVLRKNLR